MPDSGAEWEMLFSQTSFGGTITVIKMFDSMVKEMNCRPNWPMFCPSFFYLLLTGKTSWTGQSIIGHTYHLLTIMGEFRLSGQILLWICLYCWRNPTMPTPRKARLERYGDQGGSSWSEYGEQRNMVWFLGLFLYKLMYIFFLWLYFFKTQTKIGYPNPTVLEKTLIKILFGQTKKNLITLMRAFVGLSLGEER